jgi:hypothetical protein
MGADAFEVLILTGRPASGKSEIIDHLTRLDAATRSSRYHLADLDILDDFPMLWTWFEEDHILSHKLGRPRLHTDEKSYFLHPDLWNLLIERLDLEYGKRLREPGYHSRFTTLVEFSRGSEHGGYRTAFQHLGDDLLRKAVVLYVRVSYEESLRKNRRRYNPDRPDSILEHGLSDEKMERLYRLDDWGEFAPGESGFLKIRDQRVPYAVFDNQDDVTTGQPEQLAARLQQVLGKLWASRR